MFNRSYLEPPEKALDRVLKQRQFYADLPHVNGNSFTHILISQSTFLRFGFKSFVPICSSWCQRWRHKKRTWPKCTTMLWANSIAQRQSFTTENWTDETVWQKAVYSQLLWLYWTFGRIWMAHLSLTFIFISYLYTVDVSVFRVLSCLNQTWIEICW